MLNQTRQVEKFIREKVNLTSFLKKKKVFVMSDLEGKIPFKIYEKAEQIFSKPENGFIYNGDIADYTGNLNVTDSQRYKFLKFIKLLNDNNNNCISILGNRDLNKIKVLPLVLFEDKRNK